MVIQSISPINQAGQPDIRMAGQPAVRMDSAPPARAVAELPAQKLPKQASVEELKRAVAAINQAMQQSDRNLEFSVDSDTKKTVVRVVDTSTGEWIRQVPTEAALAISRSIDQFQRGLLLSQKA